MSTRRILSYAATALIGLIAVGMLLDLAGIAWWGVKKEMTEDIRREVFENTQSYVHGKTQDLAKYYEQWMNAKPADQLAIENIIKMQFADFDENKIRNAQLRTFLTQVRGY